MDPSPKLCREPLSDHAGDRHDRTNGEAEAKGPPFRRALLTGATGFLGRRVTRQLLASGVEVHASRHRDASLDAPGMTWHALDLGSAKGIREVIEKVRPDVLIHLAWNVRADYQTSSDNAAWVGWSLDLAREFVRCGGRHILMAGSCAEYEWSGAPLSEDSPCRPATSYGAAKLSLSQEVQGLADEGVIVIWPRLFFLFGEGEAPERVIPHIIRDVAAGRSIDWISPDLRRDYLHADEAATAMVYLLFARASGVVNIGSGAAPTVREIAQVVAEALGRDDPAMAAGAVVTSGPLEIRADISRLRRFGWVPSRTMGDALASLSRAAVPDH